MEKLYEKHYYILKYQSTLINNIKILVDLQTILWDEIKLNKGKL